MNTGIRSDLPTPPNGWLMMQNPHPEPSPIGFDEMSAGAPTAPQAAPAADSPAPLPPEFPAAFPSNGAPAPAPTAKREGTEMWLG